MNYNSIRTEKIFFFLSLVKLDDYTIYFFERGEVDEEGLMVYGIQDTALTMRARGVSTLRATRPREQEGGGSGGGRYTFGTPALYIAEKPDLPGNKNFFLHPSRLPPSLHLAVDMQPFIKTPFAIHPPRSSYAPFAKRHHLRPFYLPVPSPPSASRIVSQQCGLEAN